MPENVNQISERDLKEFRAYINGETRARPGFLDRGSRALKLAFEAIEDENAKKREVEDAALAIHIPVDGRLGDVGLEVVVGRDGVRLTFVARSGKSAQINISSMIESRTRVIGAALGDWCSDRTDQAEKIAETKK